MDWLMLTITLMPTVCTTESDQFLLPHLQMNPQLSNQKERSVRPKVSPSQRQILIPKLGMDSIMVMVDMVDIVDTVDTTDMDMVDTTDIPMDTEGTVGTDGANRYFNLDQTNSNSDLENEN